MSEMAATPYPSQANLPFPPEIRERIYTFLLTSEDDMPITTRNDGPDTRCPSLLLVCKQICLEAFHIFYRYNNLKFRQCGRSLALPQISAMLGAFTWPTSRLCGRDWKLKRRFGCCSGVQI